VLLVAALVRTEVRLGSDRLVIAWGDSVTADPGRQREELVAALREVIREEDERWVGLLRVEWNAALQSLRADHNQMLDSRLADLQSRLVQSSRTRDAELRTEVESSLIGLLRLVSAQNREEMTDLRRRVDQLAVYDRVRADQTDAMVATLIRNWRNQ
jgi:hypothetical protein